MTYHIYTGKVYVGWTRERTQALQTKDLGCTVLCVPDEVKVRNQRLLNGVTVL